MDNLPTAMYSEYLGILLRTHGLDGSLVVGNTVGLRPALQPGSRVAVGFTRDFAAVKTVASFQQTPQRMVIRFTDLDTPEAATALLEQAVYIRLEDAGIRSADRYTIGEIEGCTAVSEQGATIGVITDVWLMPANDVWVITTESGTTLPLPVIDDTIVQVDVTARRVTVRIPDGLELING